MLAIAGAFHDFAAKAVDLVRCGLAEVLVEGLAGLELAAVYEQRSRPCQGFAVLIEVAEERKPSVVDDTLAAIRFAFEARDVVVNQLRGGRVVAHHDEAGRHLDVRLLPQAKSLLVVPIERIQGRLQFPRQV